MQPFSSERADPASPGCVNEALTRRAFPAAKAVLRESRKAEKRVLRDFGEKRICVMAVTLRGFDLHIIRADGAASAACAISQRRSV